jgi:thiosulfate/3-mercaptopyruvate sulfurtransferase
VTEPLPRLLEPHDLADPARPGLLGVHVAERTAYQRAHIPGAVLVEPRDLVSGIPPAVGQLPATERLTALFARLGYDPALDIVAYDDEGGGWAGRFIWTLDVIGHRRWSYLNGGLHAWSADDRPLMEGAGPERTPGAPEIVVDRVPIADASDVLAALGDPACCIWDARSEAEYFGLRSGSRRAGHIPGAVHLDWLRLMDPDRHLRLVADLQGVLELHGINREKEVITYCQTHHRSGLTYLAARLLEFPRVRAYHGSWAEWGNRDDTPVATGP